MKPDRTQIDNLVMDLGERHRDKIGLLKDEARKFSMFINALPAFRLVEPDPLFFVEHVGRVVVDAVLQVGHDYEKQVRKRVKCDARFFGQDDIGEPYLSESDDKVGCRIEIFKVWKVV